MSGRTKAGGSIVKMVVRLSILILLPALGAGAQGASGPAPPPPFSASKFLADLRSDAENGRWQAIGAKLAGRIPGGVVADPALESVFIPVSRALRGLLRSLPAAALQEVRRSLDPDARLLMERWRLTGDEAHLRKLVCERFHSNLSPAAANLLASRAQERGELITALRLWRRVLYDGPDDDGRAVVAGRIAHALATAGRPEGLEALSDRAAWLGLDGPMVAGTERTTFREYLAALLAQARGRVESSAGPGAAAVVTAEGGPILAVAGRGGHVRTFRIRPGGDPEFLWLNRLTFSKTVEAGGVERVLQIEPEALLGGQGILVGASRGWPGLLTAVDVLTGTRVWDAEKTLARIQAEVGFAGDLGPMIPSMIRGGRMYLAGLPAYPSDEAVAAAVELRTGRVVWATRAPLGCRTWTCPGIAAHAGRLYLGGQGGGITCLDQETGELEWLSVTGDLPKGLDAGSTEVVNPLVTGDAVVVPAARGSELVAVLGDTGRRLPSPGSVSISRQEMRELRVVGGTIVAIGNRGWCRAGPKPGPGPSRRLEWVGTVGDRICARAMEAVVLVDPVSGGEKEICQVDSDSPFHCAAVWEGKVLLVYGRWALSRPSALEPGALAARLRSLAPRLGEEWDPERAAMRGEMLAQLRRCWKRDGASALEPLERAAAAELAKAGEKDMAALFDVAARYPMTPSAGRGLVRLIQGRAAFQVEERVRETAVALPTALRRELRDAIEALLPDVDDAEAEKWEKISDWVGGLPK